MILEAFKTRIYFLNCRALQEAQDIFGVDFDFEDFDQYQDEYSEGEDDEEDEVWIRKLLI